MSEEPRTIRELYFYMKGEFEKLDEKICNVKKTSLAIGGLSGGILGALITGIFKIFGAKT